MKTKTTMIAMLMCIAVFINGCAKDGAIGPKGADGKDGKNGLNGTNGTNGTNGGDGTNGEDGNANVHNYTFNLNLSAFIGPLTNNSYNQSSNMSFMGNNFIDEKDAVLLYLFDKSIGSTNYYHALPFLDYYNNTSNFNQHSFTLGATGSANILTFNIRNSSGIQPYTSMTGTLSYKMVTIAGISKMDLLEGIDKRDYYAVCRALSLKP